VCAYGHHGNPRSGDANACKACPCPRTTNIHAESCAEENGVMTCLRCREGHEGRFCERSDIFISLSFAFQAINGPITVD